MQNTQKTVSELQDKKKAIVAAYAKGNDIVHQLIDLALLQNGMLQGAALDKFLKRSISLIKYCGDCDWNGSSNCNDGDWTGNG